MRGVARYAWLILGLVLALIELGSFLSETTYGVTDPAHPTVSDLIDPLLQAPLARGVVATVWVLAGIWLVRRAVHAGEAA